MSDTQKMQPPGRSRMLRWILGGSLALNLVFLGLFAGAALRHVRDDDEGRPRGPGIQDFGRPLARALPRDARRAVRQQMRAEASGLPSRAERQALYAQVLEALRAEPFDKQAVAEVFKVQISVAQNVQSVAQAAWLEEVAKMSVTDRREVAFRIEEALRHSRHKRTKPSDH